MDRMRRVSNLWNWLPTFRAVAETEHVRQAADRLHVSPSALSRTIRLLEEDLGQPLFDRMGRQLRVNAAGQTLLRAVRDSMRRVHDATQAIESDMLCGPIRVSAEGTLIAAFVVPAIVRIRQGHPELVPQVATGALEDPLTALRLGDIDVLLQTTACAASDLSCERLGTSSNGVYCGRDHVLFGNTEAMTLEEAAAFPFVAPPALDGRPVEGWPAEIPRTVAAMVSPMQTGVEVCRTAGLLAVFPDRVVAREREAGDLHRLHADGLPSVSFYATTRQTLGKGPVEAFVAVLRDVVNERSDRPSGP
ncbi:MAG: LysR family transcriptional regulator [Nannocystaceae bacterium]|nr:LysR family transcriptional regulator [Nannocystaceae bacterium]